MALNSALLFWVLVFEFLLDMSEAFLCSMSVLIVKSCPYAICASTANAVCRDTDAFGTKTLSIKVAPIKSMSKWYTLPIFCLCLCVCVFVLLFLIILTLAFRPLIC
jgi:hypothetical protein